MKSYLRTISKIQSPLLCLLAIIVLLVPLATASVANAARTLSFDDEFNGKAGSQPSTSLWKFDTGYWDAGNKQLECYTSSTKNIAENGKGDLVISALSARNTDCDGTVLNYTSGRLETSTTFSQRYGTFEMNAKVPTAKGMWPAFWMLGTNTNKVGDPFGGEIDVMEAIGSNSGTKTVYGTLHGPKTTSSTASYSFGGKATAATNLSAGFHTYGVVWSPTSIKFQLDGRTYYTATRSKVPKGDRWMFSGDPFYLIMNLAVGGTWPGNPDGKTVFPQRMLINWVRVYTSN